MSWKRTAVHFLEACLVTLVCLSYVCHGPKKTFRQPSACDDSKDSAFWANVCRLALADYKAEVQELLKGVAHQDPSLGLKPFLTAFGLGFISECISVLCRSYLLNRLNRLRAEAYPGVLRFPVEYSIHAADGTSWCHCCGVPSGDS